MTTYTIDIYTIYLRYSTDDLKITVNNSLTGIKYKYVPTSKISNLQLGNKFYNGIKSKNTKVTIVNNIQDVLYIVIDTNNVEHNYMFIQMLDEKEPITIDEIEPITIDEIEPNYMCSFPILDTIMNLFKWE